MTKRILSMFAALLILFTLVSCFSSCDELLDDAESIKSLIEDLIGSVDSNLETTEKNALDDKFDDDWWDDVDERPIEVYPTTVEKKSYGKEFYLSIVPDCNPMACLWVEKSSGDAMSEAVYARQERVYNYLGVEVVGTSAGTYREYVGRFRTAVEKRDGSVDCLVSHVSEGICGLVKQMYFKDFNNVQGIDLEQDYWNTDFMDSVAIDGSRYLGRSDINILYTYVIAFNKDLLDQYAGSMEKSVYQMVYDNEWTLDTMLSLAQLVSVDKTGDGKTDDDVYGLTGQQWVPWVGFFHSSNINLVEQNEKGDYELSFMNATNADKTKDLVKKLKEFSASEFAYLTYPSGGAGVPSNKVPLRTGRALMELSSTYSLENYLQYDLNFGVLPYPLYDQYQKNYRSLQWGGYLCVPSYVEDELKVGETLEVMSFYSDDVRMAFYEKMLGKQVADAPDDVRILEEYIWENVCTDFAQTYASCVPSALYFLPEVTYPGLEGKEMASYYNSFQKSTNDYIKQFIAEVIRQRAESQ